MLPLPSPLPPPTHTQRDKWSGSEGGGDGVSGKDTQLRWIDLEHTQLSVSIRMNWLQDYSAIYRPSSTVYITLLCKELILHTRPIYIQGQIFLQSVGINSVTYVHAHFTLMITLPFINSLDIYIYHNIIIYTYIIYIHIYIIHIYIYIIYIIIYILYIYL